MNSEKKTAPVVPALEKALDILEYLADKDAGVTMKEIAEALDIPPATAYRTIKYLCQRRYVRETPTNDGLYNLGPQLLHLAHLTTRRLSLIAEAQDAMKKLADLTGQTAQLGVLHDYGVTYIEQQLPRQPVNIIAALRTVIPVNVSASGKILVAHLVPEEQAHFLANATLPKQTENTIVDLDAFGRELERVKAQGYAMDDEEFARGIGCIAAPIYNDQDKVIAAIGVTGHIADYMGESRLQQIVQQVIAAAFEVSTRMGAVADSENALQAYAALNGSG